MRILQFLPFLLVCKILHAVKQSHQRPNIVFMIVDDLGWNDVSFHGSKQIPTPNIDAIARDGIILNHYYVMHTCSPSRGSLMTGKYPIQIGFQHTLIREEQPWGLPLKEKILPQYLKELGYATHIVGKWHLGFFKEEYLPLKRGFDSFFGYYNGFNDYYTHEVITENGTGGLDLHDNYKNAWWYNGTYGTDLFTAKAQKVIEEHDPEKPLFLYFSQVAPHFGNFRTPLQAPEMYVRPMVGIKDERRRIFAGMVSSMDHSVGEIFNSLEETGLLDNTIFIFTTDNGGAPFQTDGTMGSNWPLKGSKYNLWEGGVRGVSFIWSPFLRNQSRIHNELMHISDWLPTLLMAAGGPEALKMLPEETKGVNQWQSLTHGLPSSRSEVLINLDSQDGTYAFRKGRYKLIKGSYRNNKFDKWYDKEGKVFNITDFISLKEKEEDEEEEQKEDNEKDIYNMNYLLFLKRSKAANVLRQKYDKDPRLAINCQTEVCKDQLELKCKRFPSMIFTCDARKKKLCLFDIISDPCEYYNIAEQLPEVTVELELAVDGYRPIEIPSGAKPPDHRADPKLHGNVWVPWK